LLIRAARGALHGHFTGGPASIATLDFDHGVGVAVRVSARKAGPRWVMLAAVAVTLILNPSRDGLRVFALGAK
jgi:hypothetical protein